MSTFELKATSASREELLPRLPLDLSKHKLPIALYWTPIVITSCSLLIIGYFTLRYATSLELTIILSILLSIMGGVSALSFSIRTWALWCKDSNCRPLGVNSRWSFDYFFWNFLFTFSVLTALITSGIVTENMQIVSLPLSVLMLWVCLQMLIAEVLLLLGVKVPFRMGSLAKGNALRSGTFVIVDDVVAVDGKQGNAWRHAWNERYLASPTLGQFLSQMDRLWGCNGLGVVAVVWGVVFGVDNHDVGYALV